MGNFFTHNRSLFTLLLAMLGQFSLNTHFNRTSKILLAAGVVWSFCRVGVDVINYSMTGYSILNHAHVYPIEKFGYVWLCAYRLMNTLYCLVMSFHPEGFHLLFQNLDKLNKFDHICVTGNRKIAKLVLVAMYALFFFPSLFMLTFTGIHIDYEAFVDKHWYLMDIRYSMGFKVFIYGVVFQIIPCSFLLFHFLLVVAMLTILDKFHRFNQQLTILIKADNHIQNQIPNIEKQFHELQCVLENFTNKFSVVISVDICYWMATICGMLYAISFKVTYGYDLYVAVYLLQLVMILLCCCLLNSEVRQCTAVSHISDWCFQQQLPCSKQLQFVCWTIPPETNADYGVMRTAF